MTTTLYRKYRPQRFADVIGQEHVTTTLQHQIVSGKLAHAYLFCGTRGVGKTTVARLLAKALNCESRKQGQAEPCGECTSCQATAAGRSLDLIEIDAASNRRIDDVRELREHIPYGPTSSAYKVIIVDEVHMLTTEAFNALLKTLEEPPSHVVFVLATTEVHKLPDTITSRCQRFDFRRITTPLLIERLQTLAHAEGVAVDDDVLAQVADIAQGSSRDAESYLGKLVSLGEKHIDRDRASLVLPHSDRTLCLTFLTHLVGYHAGEAVGLLNRFIVEGGEVGEFHRQVLELMRQLMLLKLGGKTTEADGSSANADLHKLAQAITTARAQAMLEQWLVAADRWRNAEVPQLPLELAAVALAEPPTHAPTTEAAPAPRSTPPQARPPEPVLPGISLAAIQERWPQVVAKLRDYNHSLSFILSIARPAALEGKTITVVFQYKLHHDRVHDPKVREAIEQALYDVTGVSLALRGSFEAAPAEGDLLANVLTTFGGQVVG